MSILAIKDNNKRYHKVLIVYFLLTCFTILINKIYSLFGHGVSSDAMTFMFLYPLIGGFCLFLLIRLFLPNINRFSGYRLFFNSYNSGIATLTVGSFLTGVFDIAGTASTYVNYYYIFGWSFIGMGLVLLSIMIFHYNTFTVMEH